MIRIISCNNICKRTFQKDIYIYIELVKIDEINYVRVFSLMDIGHYIDYIHGLKSALEIHKFEIKLKSTLALKIIKVIRNS